MKKKIKIKVGIVSPVAAGAGTISKLIAKNYKLLFQSFHILPYLY